MKKCMNKINIQLIKSDSLVLTSPVGKTESFVTKYGYISTLENKKQHHKYLKSYVKYIKYEITIF